MKSVEKNRVFIAVTVFLFLFSIILCCLLMYQKYKSTEYCRHAGRMVVSYQKSIKDNNSKFADQIQFPAGKSHYLEPLFLEMPALFEDQKSQKELERFVAQNLDFVYNCERISRLRLKNVPAFKYSQAKKILFFYCDRMMLSLVKNDKNEATRIVSESFYFFHNLANSNSSGYLCYLQLALIWRKIIMANFLKHFQLTKSERDDLSLMLKDIKSESLLREFYSLQYEHLDILEHKLSANNSFPKEWANFIGSNIASFFKELEEDIGRLSASDD